MSELLSRVPFFNLSPANICREYFNTPFKSMTHSSDSLFGGRIITRGRCLLNVDVIIAQSCKIHHLTEIRIFGTINNRAQRFAVVRAVPNGRE